MSAERVVALLRAVNVGGRNVTMERLRELFTGLGLDGVATYIASGNVLFDAPDADHEGLTRRIEATLAEGFGFEVTTFLRPVADLARVATIPPFSPDEVAAATSVNVAFLARPLDAAQLALLAELGDAIDTLRADGREIYWLCDQRQSESRLTNAGLERRLGVSATMRSRRTVRALSERAA